MQRWLTLVGAVMLVLMLWTGGAAHAAERFDCIPASSEAPGHFEGDRDQAPAKGEKGVAHHHSGCPGHQLGAPADGAASLASTQSAAFIPGWIEERMSGHSPDRQLRPPIA